MSELLNVENLKKSFPVSAGIFAKGKGWVYAVDGVTFHIDKGETLGLVGESGCGKSTLGRAILRIIEPTSGKVFFNGQSILGLKEKSLRAVRKNMQMIFQDPFASLNPRMTIRDIVGESLIIHRLARGRELEEKVARLLDVVGLPRDALSRYPHEFSGGQRQRIAIARALAPTPKFIVADEPVSALDVSIQAQIINLLQDIQKEFHITYLFIAHDLRVVEYISDRVIVMYLGKIMEFARAGDLYTRPIHPYSEALLSAVPLPDPRRKKQRISLKGEIPSPINPPSGCVFHTRCIYARERCIAEVPELLPHREDQYGACHFPLIQ